ncbi:R3H domain-containing nucleic acid-binding protein [Lapillicoccus sp.]|uniref:Jag family protein n=1 Tax=Lapillicoccus sp. TaxID=1909287 RepID=UPI00326345E7
MTDSTTSTTPFDQQNDQDLELDNALDAVSADRMDAADPVPTDDMTETAYPSEGDEPAFLAVAAETGTSESSGTSDPAGAVAGPRNPGGRVGLLEREGEVAADFLERLLDIADLDGDIEVDIDGDRAAVAIVDSEEGRVPRRLVGADGKVLEALQELTRLAVQAETGERSRLMLDVAGHRAQRRTTLVEVAQAAIADVRSTHAQKALDNMTAFERKIVHDEVSAAGLSSESEGVEPHRHIVILPA